MSRLRDFFIGFAFVFAWNTWLNKPKRFAVPGNGSFGWDCVGEAGFQDELKSITGQPSGKVRLVCQAELHLENRDHYDGQIVRVVIARKTVAYLDRDQARHYRAQIARGNQIGICQALVMGGGPGQKYIGVWLDVAVKHVKH